MDGFFVAKLKKFAPGERKAVSTTGVPDKDAPEANEEGGADDAMEDRLGPDTVLYLLLCVCVCVLFVTLTSHSSLQERSSITLIVKNYRRNWRN